MLYQDPIDYEREIKTPSMIKQYSVLLEIFYLKVLRDRKTYILVLIGILPILVVLISPSNNVIQAIFSYIQAFRPGDIATLIHIPLISLILGISAVGDEKENKTISQLVARPIKRYDVIVCKWFVSITTGIVMITAINVIYYLINAVLSSNSQFILENVNIFIGTSVFLWIYLSTYISIFLLIGVIIEKNALTIGLFIAYFEVILSQFIFGLGSGSRYGTPYSIPNHVYHVASKYLIPEYFNYTVLDFEPQASALVILGIVVLSLAGAILAISMKDL
ncbi:MAG: ABC transporter permease [Candidatus Hodarchaeales archaeon]